MTNVMERLTGHADAEAGSFTVVSRYNPDMDFFLYLTEDCAFRADRVDGFLTLLWHPQEERLVGLKLKGFRFLFQQLTKMQRLDEEEFVPLVNYIELAVMTTMTEEVLAQLGEERLRDRRDKYNRAREWALEATATITKEEWQKVQLLSAQSSKANAELAHA